MKGNKCLALILLLTMCFSAIPEFWAYAENETGAEAAEYLIINDQFGDNDTCGWLMDSTGSDGSTLESVQIEQGNYALKYYRPGLSDGTTEAYNVNHILRKINGDKGIKYKDGINTVIETRFKVKSAGEGRIFFKDNIDTTSSAVINGGKQTGRSSGWNTMFAILGNKSGQLHYANGTTEWGYNLGTTAVDSTNYTGLADGETWIEAEICIKGASGKADYTFKSDNLPTVTGEMNLTQPEVHSNAINDMLKTFAVAYRNSDNTVWIDYFKLYQQGVTVSATGATVDSVGVKVDIQTNADYLNDISKYIKLYEEDGTTEVQTTNTYDSEKSKVILVPQTSLTAGKTYKVVIDKTKLQSNLLYTYNGSEALDAEAPACSAENLSISGKIVPGKSLTANFDLKPSGLTENNSVYKWYTVNEKGEQTEIGGASGKTLDIDDSLADSRITFSVIPKAVDANDGEKVGLEAFCDVPVIPEAEPVLKNDEVRYSADKPMVGYTIEAEYDYYDANGDAENGTEIKWYVGSSASASDFELVGSGEKLDVTAKMKGKYIYCTVRPKNKAEYRAEGSLYTGAVIGPCDDIISATNLLKNGDFESGSVEPWIIHDDWPGVETPLSIYSEDKYEGDYCLKVATTPARTSGWKQNVSDLKENTTYIISGMLKATDTASVPYEGYVWSGTGERPYRDSEIVDINNETWTRVTHTRINNGPTMGVGFAGYGVVGGGSDGILVDNIYFGELMISDIKTYKLNDEQVPDSGESTLKVASGEILNQLGTTDGLKAQSVKMSVAEGSGIDVKGNYISVTSGAVAGKVKIKVYCEPTLPGVKTFEKYVEFNLLPNSNTAPKAENVKITGDVAENGVLALTYDYYQVENKANASEYQWLWSDSADGTYKSIDGAVGDTYTVTSQYAQKYIKCAVYPKTTDGMTGETVYSNVLVRPVAPTAKDIGVSGDWYVGGSIKGKYLYVDDNGDAEGSTTFRWLASDTENGEYKPISDETSDTLVLTENMIGKYIKFEVTPISTAEPSTGETVLSVAYAGPSKPYAEDVSISVDGLVYKGNYTYKHSHAIKETETEYEWKLNGKVIGTGKNYVAKSQLSGTLTFTVTPVCAKAPNRGESVSCSVKVKSSGSGGSSGGGGYSVAPVVGNIEYPESTVAEDDSNKENVTNTTYSDVSADAWYYNAVEFVHSNRLMQGTGEGFEPEANMSKAMLVTVLWRMKNEPNNQSDVKFADVEDEQWYTKAIAWAVSESIVLGYDDMHFGTNDNITREQLAVILYRYAEKSGIDVSACDDVDLSVYGDADLISEFAVPALKWAVGAGIINGETDTELNPLGYASRAQVAAMLQRFSDILM